MLLQTFGFSNASSFMTSPTVGPNSTLEFLVIADLGHYQVDGSFEYDYEESADVLNYQATGHLVDAEDPMTVRSNPISKLCTPLSNPCLPMSKQ